MGDTGSISSWIHRIAEDVSEYSHSVLPVSDYRDKVTTLVLDMEVVPPAEDTPKIEPPPAFLTKLNHTTLENLSKVTRDSPAIDLRKHLGEQARKYRAEYAKITEQPEPPPPLDSDAAIRSNFLLPTDGTVEIRLPLSQQVADILCEPSLAVNGNHEMPLQFLPSRIRLFQLLERGDWIHQLNLKAVVKIAPDIVVKICKTDGMVELMNIGHIRAHSSFCEVPVPEPLGMLQHKNRFYIFMTFISGMSLENIWNELESVQKVEIQQQLNAIFSKIRRLPLPSKDGYLGAGDPLRCKDGRRWTRESTSIVKNEHEFNDFLFTEHHAPTAEAELIRPIFRVDHRIVMTHGDLHPRNILVDSKNNLRITGIIDWDRGGGYPEYWEYVKALFTGFMEEAPDWSQFLPEAAIGKYIEDYARDLVVQRMVN